MFDARMSPLTAERNTRNPGFSPEPVRSKIRYV
jgi:hypothetical protein